MRLFASSDLHLDQKENFYLFERSIELKRAEQVNQNTQPQDCLILAGDICETEAQLETCLSLLRLLYKEIIWLPGNHELWIRPSQRQHYSGSEQKYFALVTICRKYGVRCPEDAFLKLIDPQGKSLIIAPLFILYDYSFRPGHVSAEAALDWALDNGVMCSDEVLLLPAPHKSVTAWCRQRFDFSLQRLQEAERQSGEQTQFLLANHFPLNEKSFYLEFIPSFSLWCGTRLTEHWHQHFNTRMVINGHLHLPGEQEIDGVTFKEVSLGYPGQWDSSRPMLDFFQELFPGTVFSVAPVSRGVFQSP